MRTTLRMAALALAALLAGCGATIDRMTGEGEADRIRRVGQRGEAVVLDISDTGVTLNDDPVVVLHLEVRRGDGTTYTATARALISRLDIPQVQPGATLAVAIDPADPAKVALSGRPGRR
ncbi:hypothetical protein [Luteitalea sp.]|jgi:hypothetical protein